MNAPGAPTRGPWGPPRRGARIGPYAMQEYVDLDARGYWARVIRCTTPPGATWPADAENTLRIWDEIDGENELPQWREHVAVVQPKAPLSRAIGFIAANLAIKCCNPMSGVVESSVDGAGNRYRTSAASIEKLSSSGEVLARWTKKIPDVAQAYAVGGTGADQFAHPMDLAIDTQGNLYLSDGCDFCNGFYHVQKISPSGQPLARWALDGVGPGQVHDNRGVTVDAVGNVYLVDAGNGRVVKYAPNGPVLAQFGRRGKGPGELGYPFGIAVDVAGNVYVGDSENKRVQKFSPDGTPTLGFTPGGPFVALDAEGNVYTSDADMGLTKFSPSGQVLSRADGSSGNVALMLGK